MRKKVEKDKTGIKRQGKNKMRLPFYWQSFKSKRQSWL